MGKSLVLELYELFILILLVVKGFLLMGFIYSLKKEKQLQLLMEEYLIV